MGRLAALAGAMALGACLPGLSAFSEGIRWILLWLLFFAFLDLDATGLKPEPAHLRLLAAWPLLALAGWFLLRPWGPEAALAGFLVGATPTATAAPVVTGLLGGRAGFVALSVLGSNLLAATFLPPLLGLLSGASARLPSGFLVSTMGLVLVPLALSRLVRRAPGFANRLRPWKRHSFTLWLVALVLAASRTSDFLLRHRELSPGRIVAIAGGSLALCVAQFAAGRALGWRSSGLEAGQSLGQKNTMLTLWLALAIHSPVAALGPASYVLWHNLWNGWQLGRASERARRPELPAD